MRHRPALGLIAARPLLLASCAAPAPAADAHAAGMMQVGDSDCGPEGRGFEPSLTKADGCVLAPGLALSPPTLPMWVGRHRWPWPGVASMWASTPASTSEWSLPET